ncbi:global transcription activator snf2l2 [Pelomyxa schiedti]|nr:global transcription activator snf2l2 [Pelomyxa schiedti]
MHRATSEQALRLRAHVCALRHLVRNCSVPPLVLSAVGPPIAPSEDTDDHASTQTHAASVSASAPPTQQVQCHQDHDPGCGGTDTKQLCMERDQRVNSRVQNRLLELQSNYLSFQDQRAVRCDIEMRMLKLLSVQQQCRVTVLTQINRLRECLRTPPVNFFHFPISDQSFGDQGIQKKPEMDAHFSHGKRDSNDSVKPPYVYTTNSPQLVNCRSIVGEERKVTFAPALFQELFAFFEKKKETQKLHTAACDKFKQDFDKFWKEKTRKQITEREKRLKSLKTEKPSEYQDEIEKARKDRLNKLLQKTEDWFSQVQCAIENERNTAEEETKTSEEPSSTLTVTTNPNTTTTTTTTTNTTTVTSPGDSSLDASSTTYYTRAHSVVETIHQQPTMLTGELREYQLTGLQWLVSLYNNKLNGILADEMGLGKTVQAIALLCYLMEKKGENGPHLIITPSSTVENWYKEFLKWAPGVKVLKFSGAPTERKLLGKQITQNPKPFHVLLTTPSFVLSDKLSDKPLKRVKWSFFIVDEGHRLKNRQSKLSKVMRQYTSKHRLLLTGTPIQNDLSELWSLLNFLDPEIFNSSPNFTQWFNAPFSGNKKNEQPLGALSPEEEKQIIDKLHQVLRPFILRRMKKDVETQMPEKIEIVLQSPLSALQLSYYKQMTLTNTLTIDPSEPMKNYNVKTMKFNNPTMHYQKICNHPYLFHNAYRKDENIVRASGKFDLLDQILKKMIASNHRVLIFCHMTQVIDIMKDYFALRPWADQYLVLEGNTKTETRGTLVDLWNAPDSTYVIFVLSTHAGGLGLNLQTADTVVIFDTDWNPQMDLQAQDRCHRIGQRKEVRVFRLVTPSTIEEEILKRANSKLNMEEKVIKAGMFNQVSTPSMRREELERLLAKHSAAETPAETGEVLNESLARTAEEFDLFQNMDAADPPQNRLVTAQELPEEPVLPNKQEEENVDGVRRKRHSAIRATAALLAKRPRIAHDETMPSESSEYQPDLDSAIVSEVQELDEGGSEEQVKSPCPANPKRHSHPQQHRPHLHQDNIQTPANNDFPSKCHAIWQQVVNARDASGRKRAIQFMELPNPKEWPIYYKFIKQPICFQEIQKRNYKDTAGLASDYFLLFRNAMEFNQEGSQIFIDAIELQTVFSSEFEAQFGIPPPQPSTAIKPQPAPTTSAASQPQMTRTPEHTSPLKPNSANTSPSAPRTNPHHLPLQQPPQSLQPQTNNHHPVKIQQQQPQPPPQPQSQPHPQQAQSSYPIPHLSPVPPTPPVAAPTSTDDFGFNQIDPDSPLEAIDTLDWS